MDSTVHVYMTLPALYSNIECCRLQFVVILDFSVERALQIVQEKHNKRSAEAGRSSEREEENNALPVLLFIHWREDTQSSWTMHKPSLQCQFVWRTHWALSLYYALSILGCCFSLFFAAFQYGAADLLLYFSWTVCDALFTEKSKLPDLILRYNWFTC